MRDSSRRGTNEIFIARRTSYCHINGCRLISSLAINSDASRTVRRAPVIQAVKQTVQLPRKGTQRRDNCVVFDTCCGLVKV
jgi:hypothetical protein